MGQIYEMAIGGSPVDTGGREAFLQYFTDALYRA